MADELSHVHLTGRQIRVLAHPLRIRLLARLRGDGPATATQLANTLSTNTGATSYHLRQLAEAGLVVEEERPGGGRQRWWRAVHDMSSWHRSDYVDDPDAAAAVVWLETFQVNRFVELAETWQHGLSQESQEWSDTGGISDYLLTLSPAQVRSMLDELDEVVERYARADPEPGARRVDFYMAALPKSRSETEAS
ncbi:putative ArsR-family transcriptional regulator [Actinoplanes missouriensis 431]|uniref:Putative ArsR-family transcriptional regulator n=1 Tax=Actinoplanes missouriensis (strain ATCC 14538 / DSM 43046 / CBS 188.64 / JCM 3121 / NBRC 102363 / NCIMB 12654 / NRRL B-3342 / UNCC 431) TaxID=512565 RepID=I0HEM3_ACTM4|nr:winged helix-turn-helix domain-containing protein [Actinoplanes missouriensis]BAL91460.1 putative ArsR-family transcriptional regulator [Actinoplanes missouriensis 431]